MPTLWEFLFGKTPPDLFRGSRSEHVGQAQDQLNRRNNAGLNVDDAFGPLTEQAVKDFQRKRGLHVDGIIGKHTRRELRKWWL